MATFQRHCCHLHEVLADALTSFALTPLVVSSCVLLLFSAKHRLPKIQRGVYTYILYSIQPSAKEVISVFYIPRYRGSSLSADLIQCIFNISAIFDIMRFGYCLKFFGSVRFWSIVFTITRFVTVGPRLSGPRSNAILAIPGLMKNFK